MYVPPKASPQEPRTYNSPSFLFPIPTTYPSIPYQFPSSKLLPLQKKAKDKKQDLVKATKYTLPSHLALPNYKANSHHITSPIKLKSTN